MNCSATEAISLRRVDLRKARMKRVLWIWALRKVDHLESMMVQEKTLAMRRMMRTAKATGPLLCTISRRALLLPGAAAGVAGSSCWKRCRAKARIESIGMSN